MKRISIAIDGPAASGKSTTAKLVARKLGYLHLDTGAMYRAITLGILRQRIGITDLKEIRAFVERAELVVVPNGNEGNRIFLNGIEVSKEIRSPEVTRNVSAVSSYQAVREVLVREQRKIAANGGIVLEGRDIGTVVLPDAELKIFMIANVPERARRRRVELENAGIALKEEEIVKEIEERDMKDSTRSLSPLKMASDAVELDTSNLTIEEQVEFIVKRAERLVENVGRG